MRHDAARLLCERPRRGHGDPSIKTGKKLNPNVDWDEDSDTGPRVAPISRRRQFGYNAKEFSDFLTPLERFLEKNCGNPWDDVYSEICKVADARSMQGNHLRQHARDYIKWKYHIDKNGILRMPLDTWWRRRYHRSKTKGEINFIKESDLVNYEKRKGLWFKLEFRENDPNEIITKWVRSWYSVRSNPKSRLQYGEHTARASEFPDWKPYMLIHTKSCNKHEIQHLKTLMHLGIHVTLPEEKPKRIQALYLDIG